MIPNEPCALPYMHVEASLHQPVFLYPPLYKLTQLPQSFVLGDIGGKGGGGGKGGVGGEGGAGGGDGGAGGQSDRFHTQALQLPLAGPLSVP
jgi:uncharacterized membrane protein YgcG